MKPDWTGTTSFQAENVALPYPLKSNAGSNLSPAHLLADGSIGAN